MSLLRHAVLIGGLALLCPGLIVAVAALTGVGHRWIDILAQFTAPALAAVVALTLVFAVLRRPLLVGGGTIIALLLLIAVSPQWLAPRDEAEPNTPIIRLYSANLWARNGDTDAIIRSIRAADADILALIEVGDASAARIDHILAGYPHRVMQDRRVRPTGASQIIIASRYPLTLVPDPRDGLSSAMARAQTPIGPVTVMAVHLTRPWPFQIQWGQVSQANSIARRHAAIAGPLIVAGDFNSVSSARIGRQVQSETGLVPAPGWPGTWPSFAPSAVGMTIDQIYRSPDLALIDRRLGRPTGSDHRPVITEFSRAAARP